MVQIEKKAAARRAPCQLETRWQPTPGCNTCLVDFDGVLSLQLFRSSSSFDTAVAIYLVFRQSALVFYAYSCLHASSKYQPVAWLGGHVR